MGKFQKVKRYNPVVQEMAMKAMFPDFTAKKIGSNGYLFRGVLNVHPRIQQYEIEVLYKGNNDPIVKILSPDIDKSNPHYYRRSDCLCLYKPELFKWRKQFLVAKYIIPWTAAWIYFYEYWVQNGIWIGPEAPHDTPKEENNE